MNGQKFPLVLGIKYVLLDLGPLRQRFCLLRKIGLNHPELPPFREQRASHGAPHAAHLGIVVQPPLPDSLGLPCFQVFLQHLAPL